MAGVLSRRGVLNQLRARVVCSAIAQPNPPCLVGGNCIRIWYIALNYLNKEKSLKGGILLKQKKTALDEAYMANIIEV